MVATRPPLITDDELDDLEREAIGRVRGRVLEIGAGEGENFGAFDPEVEWIGLEPDSDRRRELAQRAREWKHARDPLDAVAERIPLDDASVDAVVGTYVLCSVTDQATALAEVRRVLRPGGTVVFVDHVAAPPGTLKRGIQRVVTPFSRRYCHGCHWDRDTGAALAAAGFEADQARLVRVPSFPFGPTRVLVFRGRVPGEVA
ncbi:class I SAM-dependent methyltransferase [Agromyces sp. M3QZ16-3]|uniref:class I SAM-dependent methyltransferase n=1 Tax=Agromyces sp. M3QZ16-3 TaxID=3447585 RepID=UPI003F691D16